MSEKKRGLYDLKIKEAKTIGIRLADLFSVEIEGRSASLNFSWDLIIKTVNYLSGEKTLTEESTLREAFKASQSFLV